MKQGDQFPRYIKTNLIKVNTIISTYSLTPVLYNFRTLSPLAPNMSY